jgi:hypothetical protein
MPQWRSALKWSMVIVRVLAMVPGLAEAIGAAEYDRDDEREYECEDA